MHIIRYARDNGEQITTQVPRTKHIARALLLAGYVLKRTKGVTVEDKEGRTHAVVKGPNQHLALTRVLRVVEPVTPRVLVIDDTPYDFYSHNDFLALCSRYGRYSNVVVEADEQMFAVNQDTWVPTRHRRVVLLTPRTGPPPSFPTSKTIRVPKTLVFPLKDGSMKEEIFYQRDQLERLLVDNGFPINRIGTLVAYTTASGEEVHDRYVSSNTHVPMTLTRIRVTQPPL